MMQYLLSLTFKANTTVAMMSFIESGAGGCNFATGNIHADCIPDYLAHVLKLIFSLVGVVCFFMIIIAGYQIMLGNLTGGGKDAGKTTLLWAIIGFIISALSFFIVDFVITAIGG